MEKTRENPFEVLILKSLLYKLGTYDTIRFKEILGISYGRMGFKKTKFAERQNGRSGRNFYL